MFFGLISVEKSLILIILSQHIIHHNTVKLLRIVLFLIDDNLFIEA